MRTTTPSDSFNMAQRLAMRKENQALSDLSLLNLGRIISTTKWSFFMRLCIPTSTIIQCKVNVHETGQSEVSIAQKMLLLWKRLNVTADDNFKIDALTVALRDSGFTEIAENVRERFAMNQEITSDLLG